jgi:tetratricopeptide (TPR) repeat protein
MLAPNASEVYPVAAGREETDAGILLRRVLDRAVYRFTVADYGTAYQLLVEFRAAVDQGVPVKERDGDVALRYLARNLIEQGRPDHADALLAASVVEMEARYGLRDATTSLATVTLGDALLQLERLDTAEATYRRVSDLSVGPAEPAWWARQLGTAGVALVQAGRQNWSAARQGLTKVLQMIDRHDRLDEYDAFRIAAALTRLHYQAGDEAQAAALLAKFVPLASAELGRSHPLTIQLAAISASRPRLDATHGDLSSVLGWRSSPLRAAKAAVRVRRRLR